MSQKQEWFIDTQKTDNQFFTLQNFERSDRIHNWDYSESAPIFKNETISIYDTFNWSSGREGFIIETKENILIIQVTEDTRTREKVLYCLDNSESMKMKLFAGYGVDYDGNECDMYQDTEIQSVEILLSSCLLILNYDDDLKIFIDEFDHKSSYDGLNMRLNDKLLKSISDPESSDEYNQPFGNCDSIEFTKVETSFYEQNDCDYIRSIIIYQILKQSFNSVLIIKEYEIKFTNIYEKQKISKSQVHFSLPKFPCLNFDDIQTIDSNDISHTLIIYYKDTIKKDFLMTLQIIKDYSKVMNISDTYDDSYYIFRSSLDKIQIYPSYYVKTAPSWKKLIGIIDFDNDEHEDNRFKNMFVKSHLTRR